MLIKLSSYLFLHIKGGARVLTLSRADDAFYGRVIMSYVRAVFIPTTRETIAVYISG